MSLLALVTAIVVHVRAWLGHAVMDPLFAALHVAAVGLNFVPVLSRDRPRSLDLPRWQWWLLGGLAAYAFVNFAGGFVAMAWREDDGADPPMDVFIRMFSGHWMLFLVVAVILNANVARRRAGRSLSEIKSDATHVSPGFAAVWPTPAWHMILGMFVAFFMAVPPTMLATTAVGGMLGVVFNDDEPDPMSALPWVFVTFFGTFLVAFFGLSWLWNRVPARCVHCQRLAATVKRPKRRAVVYACAACGRDIDTGWKRDGSQGTF